MFPGHLDIFFCFHPSLMWLPEAWEQYKAAREALANTTGSTEVILSEQELTFLAGEAGCRRDRRSCALSDVPAGRSEIALLSRT